MSWVKPSSLRRHEQDKHVLFVRVSDVNRIGNKSRLSATENFETVSSSLKCGEDYWKQSWLVVHSVHTTDTNKTRQFCLVLCCPCWWCELGIRLWVKLLLFCMLICSVSSAVACCSWCYYLLGRHGSRTVDQARHHCQGTAWYVSINTRFHSLLKIVTINDFTVCITQVKLLWHSK